VGSAFILGDERFDAQGAAPRRHPRAGRRRDLLVFLAAGFSGDSAASFPGFAQAAQSSRWGRRCLGEEERKAEEPAGHGSVHKESSFAAANVRNPFWPIGWTKPQATDSESVAAAPALTPAAFSLTSVAIGAGRRFAILNRKILHEGQQFSLQLGRQLYQITLKAVQDGRVVLAYDGGELVVPLQRR
jgi:hypothetical protein